MNERCKEANCQCHVKAVCPECQIVHVVERRRIAFASRHFFFAWCPPCQEQFNKEEQDNGET